MQKITYRTIAEHAGVSHVTVSYAMRNRSGVSAQTRKRILEVARTLGYKPNPMVAALMSSKQRALMASGSRRAIIAGLVEKSRWHFANQNYRDSLKALSEHFEQNGFIFEELHWEDFGESSRRLFRSLRARRVPGVVFLAGEVPEWCLGGWEKYALASMGNRRLNISCDYVSTDHYLDTWMCMEQLGKLGYRRIGIVMQMLGWQTRDAHRHLSACLGWNALHGRPLPYLLLEYGGWDKERILNWVRDNKLDAVVSMFSQVLDIIREAGIRVPEELGFAHLELQKDWKDISGVRQSDSLAGSYAAQLLMENINNNNYGVAEHPKSVQVLGKWFEGKTTRFIA